MSTALVPVDSRFALDPERGIINTETGEVVALADAESQTLAALDEALRYQRDFAKAALAAVEEELKTRIKDARARTLNVGTHFVELERKREWDPYATWEALTGLIAAGLISGQDADEAMPEKVERKPDGRKLNALLTQIVGDDPEAAQPLARARSERTYIKLARTSVDAEVIE